MGCRAIIGIVGGVGPYAGIDLNRKIFDQTISNADEDHLPVVLVSDPGLIGDRTAFLCGDSGSNPCHGIIQVLKNLDTMGATVAGIPCNTAHAPAIFDPIINELWRTKASIEIVHMIREVATFLRQHFPTIANVGILATNGTVKSNIYAEVLARFGINTIYPDTAVQANMVHRSVYDANYGIKARSNPVTARARKWIQQAAGHLISKGADLIILGCTELPLAVTAPTMSGKPIVDSTLVLARALIRRVAPEKVRPIAVSKDDMEGSLYDLRTIVT